MEKDLITHGVVLGQYEFDNDTFYEEARHGKAFEGFLNRFFK